MQLRIWFLFACLLSATCTTSKLNLCPIALDGNCHCFEHLEEMNSATFVGPKPGLLVECSNMTGISLHHDIDSIAKFFNGTKSVFVLKVSDSNLAHLRGLPSGLIDLKHLTLVNTNIDLEQIRESSEILVALKTFKIYRENFTEIPGES